MTDDSTDLGDRLAAPVPPLPRRRTSSLVALLAGIAVVATAFGAGFLAGRGTAPLSAVTPSGSPTPASGSPAASPAPASTALAGLPREGRRLGRADARVVMEYWADYQCSFCAEFAQEVLPELADRIADGTLAVVHRDFAFLGQESLDAAVAAHCADRQDRYWDMHDALYLAQAGQNQGAFAPTRLTALAGSIGLDPTSFATCVADRAPLVEVLDDNSAAGRAGITSTPTVIVNGRRFLGITDTADLIATIDAAAAGATPAPDPSVGPLPDPWATVATDGRTAGADDAPVTVELWVDYQAAGMASLVQTLEPALIEGVGDGTVRLVRRDLALLGAESEKAAVSVRCVERQDASGWFVHDILGSSGGGGTGLGVFIDSNLLRLGSRIWLDMVAFDACLRDVAVAAEVQAETADGRARGYDAAPVVVVRAGETEVARFTGTIDTAAVIEAVEDAAGTAPTP